MLVIISQVILKISLYDTKCLLLQIQIYIFTKDLIQDFPWPRN